MKTFLTLLLCGIAIPCAASAAVVEYELVITETTLSPAGSPRRALAINGGIPGPTLHFQEGDTARVTVRNQLKEETTSVHWHGLLVPNEMDGVPYVTTPPIQPGSEHVFEFPLRQSGTYWYHSHTGLQEQRGVYGGIVISRKDGETHAVDHDYVVVLSDWTNESPDEVMRTLMRGSEYYAFKKGNAQSLVGAWRAGKLTDYLRREKSRMPPMDISDVYYDAFLINGNTVGTVAAKPGETVRLRIINAAASSYFYVQSATGALRIVAADGPAVEPVDVERLLIGNAETYDAIVTIPGDGAWELRATAVDNSGHASLFLGEGAQQLAADVPPPQLYSMDEMLAAGMSSMDDMATDTPAAGMDAMDDDMAEEGNRERPQAPYPRLQAPAATTLPEDAPVREMELRLTGDMTRYIWSFNGKTYNQESTIPVKEGEVLRITFINDTMMHHPLHLHGHFFRLINQHGARSPLKHTVDVPPMGRRTIEFLANEYGDWLFHCHLLYHMHAGMTRVFSYRQAEDPAYKPTTDPGHMLMSAVTLEGMALNSVTMGHAHVMRGRETFGVHWKYIFGGHSSEHGALLERLSRPSPEDDDNGPGGEYELDLHWGHYFGPNFSTTIGYRLSNEDGTGNRAFGQLAYRLPYLVETTLLVDSRGDVNLGVLREFQITPRLSTQVEAEFDTNAGFEWSTYTSYLLNKEFSLTGGYHSDYGLGAGLSFRF